MNTVSTNRNGFNSIILKLANMRKEQDFTIYPYKGGDTIYLQSDKRWITANLRTGAAKINNKNKDYATSMDLLFNAIDTQLPAEAVTALQGFLWHNEGKNGGCSVIQWENKELFAA
jgi:hypothetical protein